MTDPVDRESSAEEASPVLVEGFEDFRRIGSGGFSSVYRARQIRMGRPVAIKVLHSDISSAQDRRVFERECRAMGVLSRHPNIVTVYSDAYTVDGRACLVMELYHGNYRERLDATGPLPIRELLVVGIKTAGALQAAHDTGILHRDIKPHNIFLSDFDEPALGDFGISSIDDERTITGDAALSVAYSAPEVIDEGTATYLSDVYSLSATLYHLVAGTAPFGAPRIGAVVERILHGEPSSIDRTDSPASLELLLRAGLSRSPLGRPDSAGALGWSLQEIQEELGHELTSVPIRRSERAESAVSPSHDRWTPSRSDAEETIPPDQPRPGPQPAAGGPADVDHAAQTIRRDVYDSRVARSDPDAPAATEGSDDRPPTPIARTVPSRPSTRRRPPPDESRSRSMSDRSRRIVDVTLIVAIVALVTFALVGLL